MPGRKEEKDDHAEKCRNQGHHEEGIGCLLSYNREERSVPVINQDRRIEIIFHKMHFGKNLYADFLSEGFRRNRNTH